MQPADAGLSDRANIVGQYACMYVARAQLNLEKKLLPHYSRGNIVGVGSLGSVVILGVGSLWSVVILWV